MKTSIIVILLLFCTQLLSQIDHRDKTSSSDLLSERISSELNVFEQIKYPSESFNFQNKESETIMNKVQLNDGFLLQEYIEQSWSWEDSDWVNRKRDTYVYNSKNNLSEVVHQNWVDSDWKNFSKQTLVYNENDYLVGGLYQNWDDSDWQNSFKAIYLYDDYDNWSGIVSFKWDSLNYVKTSMLSLSFDEENNLIEYLYQHWISGQAWVNYSVTRYTYDENNNLIQELFQNWNGSNWIDKHKYINGYEDNIKNISLFKHWSGFEWEDFFRYLYTYDENHNKVEDLYQYWHNSTWLDGNRHTYVYDSNNNMIEDLYQNWKDSNWADGYKYTYTYDENNNLIEELSQWWISTGLKNDNRATYSYIPMTGIVSDNNENITYKLSNNYPNPFNPSTTINYSIAEQGMVELKVYDVLGRVVSILVNQEQTSGNYEVKLDGNNLKSGVYFYQIRSGSFVESKKMVLLK
ncbi:MAG: T9SS type A sorting domain-containing protein [Bacteroidota bacterium]